MAWAWEHRDRAVLLDGPVGYLYRVGQSRTRLRMVRVPFTRPADGEPVVEPELLAALRTLTQRQRVAVGSYTATAGPRPRSPISSGSG